MQWKNLWNSPLMYMWKEHRPCEDHKGPIYLSHGSILGTAAVVEATNVACNLLHLEAGRYSLEIVHENLYLWMMAATSKQVHRVHTELLNVSHEDATQAWMGRCSSPKSEHTLIFYIMNNEDYSNLLHATVTWLRNVANEGASLQK